MAEYIERGALLQTLNENNIPYNADINYFIKNVPTADVQGVRHGKWEKQQNGKVVCSECGRKVVYQIVDGRWEYENYCPHCGAKMDKE